MRVRVFKRGKSWCVDYRWKGKRKIRAVGPTRKVADAAADAIRVQVASGAFQGASSIKSADADIETFAELCEEWMRCRSIKPATRDQYSSILKGLRCSFGERFEGGGFTGRSTPLRDITARQCEQIINRRRKASKSPVRANRYLFVLKSVFLSAVEWGVLAESPARKLKRKKEPRRDEVLLTPDNLMRVLAECEVWLRPIVLMAYHTGCRRADMLGERETGDGRRTPLRWSDVDFERGILTFSKPKEGETRRVPISTELAEVLRALPSRFSAQEVFLDARGIPVKPDRAYRRFRAAAVRAGAPQAARVRFHDLRSTCATSLIEQGRGIHEVKDILGHHSVQMTERYLRLKRDRLLASVESLPRLVADTQWKH